MDIQLNNIGVRPWDESRQRRRSDTQALRHAGAQALRRLGFLVEPDVEFCVAVRSVDMHIIPRYESTLA